MLKLDEQPLPSLRFVEMTRTGRRDPGFILSSRITTPFFNFNLSKDAVKHNAAGCCLRHNLSDTGGPLIERRRANRFQVDWEIRVERVEGSDRKLVDAGELRNLSSTGALLCLSGPLETGSQVDVHIKLPLDGNKWIRYSARVVRTDVSPAAVTAAVSFDSARPDFGTPVVPRRN